MCGEGRGWLVVVVVVLMVVVMVAVYGSGDDGCNGSDSPRKYLWYRSMVADIR